MPYSIYTKENINKVNIKIKEALLHVKDEDIVRFLNNIEKWDCKTDDEHFNILKYSFKYCEMDCHVLRKGYEKSENGC